jgi:hypothetical protein
MTPGQEDQLKLDLILHTIRLCPAEFLALASFFAEYDTPLNGLTVITQADPSTVLLARDAASSLARHGQVKGNKIAERLIVLLGKSKPARLRQLRGAEERDSRDLALPAGKNAELTRAGQDILLGGILVMWIANRAAINSAFQKSSDARAWLKPYPPSVVEVGPGLGDALYDPYYAVADAIRRTALQFDGPVGLWFRGFKIER